MTPPSTTTLPLLRHWDVVRLQLFPFLTLHDAIALLATASCLRYDRETLESVAQRFPVTAALTQGYTSLLLDGDSAMSVQQTAPLLTASLFSMAALLEKELLPHCYRWCSTASDKVRIEPFVVAAAAPNDDDDPWRALEQRFPQRLLASSTTAMAWDAIRVATESQAIHCELCDRSRLRRATRRRRRRSVFCRGAQVFSDSSDSDSDSEWDEAINSETESDSDSDVDSVVLTSEHETEDLFQAPHKPSMSAHSSLALKTPPSVPTHTESVCRHVLQPVKAFFARHPALMSSLRCLDVRAKQRAMHGTLLLGRSPCGVLTGVALCRLEHS